MCCILTLSNTVATVCTAVGLVTLYIVARRSCTEAHTQSGSDAAAGNGWLALNLNLWLCPLIEVLVQCHGRKPVQNSFMDVAHFRDIRHDHLTVAKA